MNLLIVFLLTLQPASAAFNDIYSFTLYANSDQDGKCREAAEEMGRQVQETFDAAVPGFTPFESDDGARRFLRTMERNLQIRLCSRKFCQKKVNWDWCLWNGCSCACGTRRELQQFNDNASDNANVIQAKKDLDKLLEQRSAELGCVLGLELEKVRG